MGKSILRSLLIVALAMAAPVAAARDIFIEPDAPIVALVLGDTVRLRGHDDARQAIVVRLLERYATEQGIVAEPAEIDAQAEVLRQTMQSDRQRWAARLEEVDRRLRERSLTAAERKSLTAERNVLLTLLRYGPDQQPGLPPLEDARILKPLATGIVRQWKLDRALYRQYGGRIAQQPGGPEPLDAYRRFLEERRNRGDFQIFTPELERAFWKPYAADAGQVFLASGSREEAQVYGVPPWQRTTPR
jgi:hypothetical protein